MANDLSEYYCISLHLTALQVEDNLFYGPEVAGPLPGAIVSLYWITKNGTAAVVVHLS